MVADSGGGSGGNDHLIVIDRDGSPAPTTIGDLGTSNVESIAYYAPSNTLYAVDESTTGPSGTATWGTVDQSTGAFSAIGVVGSGTGYLLDGDTTLDTVNFHDIDGLAYDQQNDVMWASVRREDAGEVGPDLLIQIDRTTGAAIPDAFGPNLDFVSIPEFDTGAGIIDDIDDIAIDPVTGDLWGVINGAGANDRYMQIVVAGGTATLLDRGPIGINDIEGMTIDAFGQVWGVRGTTTYDLIRIDRISGDGTVEFPIPLAGDHEAVTCLTQTAIPITGTVFYDDAGNGVYEPGAGDAGTAGVTVRLWHDVDEDGVITPGTDTQLTTVATGIDGSYTFGGVAGDQFLTDIDTATLPTGAVMTTDNLEIADFRSCGAGCTSDDANDFGLNYTRGTIGDFVFADVDGDGIYETGDGDVGQGGVTVDLYMDVDGNGVYETLVESQVTAVDGSYDFDELLAGDYRVNIDETTFPAGWTLTTANDPSDVTLGVGQDYDLADFGLRPLGSIGDTVYLDDDGDGTPDVGESGIDGVTVELFEDADGNGSYETFVGSQVTSGGGQYSFTNVPAGDYQVRLDVATLPADHDATSPTAVAVAMFGTDVTDADFGAAVDGSIGDTVFHDTDGDGIQDVGESGIDGVTVELFEDADGNGSYETFVGSQVTSGGGGYDFTTLPPGEYQVRVDQSSTPIVTMLATMGTSSDVALTSGADHDTSDFGFADPVSIGDLVFFDVNGNGTPDGGAETGLDGVTVELYRDTDGNGSYETLVGTQVTSGGGGYDFTGVAPGVYRVDLDVATLPAGYELSRADMIDLTAASGDDIDTADFGAGLPGSIGDLVFDDLDGDGVFDGPGGDSGVDGVTVDLYRDTDLDGTYETLVGSQVTSGGGNYDFTGVAPGVYRVDVDETSAPVAGDAVSTRDPIDVALGSGEDHDDADFGFTAPGTIGDLVFEDLDGDGVYEPGAGETGIDGITIDVYRDTDGNGTYETLWASQTAAGGGAYDVSLPPGDYYVEPDLSTVPAGYTFTTDASYELTLTAGGDIDLADFGLERQPATIGDFVFEDLDGDGVYEPGAGESGLDGVTLELYQDTDLNGSYETLVTTTATVNGSYDFAGLAPGAYQVAVDGSTLPAGYTATTPSPFSVSAAPGEDVNNADFGFRAAVASAAITKSNDAAGTASPGSTVTYTVVVTNTTGATQTGIDLVDTIPAGTTFVSGSTQVTAPVDTPADYADSFPLLAWTGSTGSAPWPSAWTEIGEGQDATGGRVQVRSAEDVMASNYVRIVTDSGTARGVERSAGDLSAFSAATLNVDWSRTDVGRNGIDHELHVSVSPNGAAFTPVMCINSEGAFTSPPTCPASTGEVDDTVGGGAPFAASIDVSALLGTDTTVRFLSNQPLAGRRGTFRLDNVQLDLTGRSDATAPGADAPDLATGYPLLDGEQLTVTYDVTVDDPNSFRSITNTASFTSDQVTTPDSAESTIVLPAGTIGDLAWDDLDGDGVYEPGAGETGIDGALVSLYEDTDGNGSYDTLVATQYTSGGGAYDFTNVPAGDYQVQLDPMTLPVGHVATTPLTRDVTLSAAGDHDIADFGARRTIDYGDAPNSYGTLSSNAGAAHGIYGPSFAGADADADGIPATPGAAATGDDTTDMADEAGVTLPALDGGTTETVTFTVTDTTGGSIWVNGWIDFDNDGIFDPGESIFDPSVFVSASVGLTSSGEVTGGPGTYTVDVDVPRLDLNGSGFAPGDRIYSRFRVATTAAQVASPNGLAPTGEVEDHSVLVSTLPVVLSYAEVNGRGGTIEVIWETAAEFDNLGFHLYGERRTGELVRLTVDPVLSENGNAALSQRYVVDVERPRRKIVGVVVEDISLAGVATRHGPFPLGEVHGEEGAAPDVDWYAEQVANATPDPTPDPSPTPTPDPSPTPDPTPEPTPDPSPTPDPTPEPTPDPSPTPDPTPEPTPDPSPSPTPEPTPDPLPTGEPAGVVARLEVATAGVQLVTATDLASAGVDLLGIPSSALGVVSGSEPIPIRVSGGAVVNSETTIEFVVSDVGSVYSPVAVFHLVLDAERARRIPTGAEPVGRPVTVATVTEHWNPDVAYSVSSPDADPWYFRNVVAFGRPRTVSLPVDLPGATAASGSIAIDLWGVTHTEVSDEHHVRVTVNGVEVLDRRFDDRDQLDVEAEVPGGVLLAGENQVDVTIVGDTGAPYDIVAINDWSITYERGLVAIGDQVRVASPTSPLAVPPAVSRGYRVQPDGAVEELTIVDGVVAAADGPGHDWFTTPSGFASPAVEAADDPSPLPGGPTDYLVISHADFLAGIEPLANYHRDRGLAVEIVDVADVYAHYGTGAIDANAIERYLDAAIPALGAEYVLLVGGDTYDYWDHDGDRAITFIPSLYAATGLGIMHAPVDPLYADVDDDGVPDAALGRLPVTTTAELDTLVAKSIRFGDLAPNREPTAVMASDGSDDGAYTSVNARFAALLDSWQLTMADVDVDGLAEAREVLLTEINAGTALASFVGHSGVREWSHEGLLTADDLGTFTNRDLPTAIAQFGCWNSYYVRADSLGTGFLTADGGAAVALGAATLTSAHHETVFAEHFFAQLAVPGVTLGDAMTAAKVELAADLPTAADILAGWTLLGDPALAVSGL